MYEKADGLGILAEVKAEWRRGGIDREKVRGSKG